MTGYVGIGVHPCLSPECLGIVTLSICPVISIFLNISTISYVPWSRLSRFFVDGKPPTFNDGILIMGI